MLEQAARCIYYKRKSNVQEEMTFSRMILKLSPSHFLILNDRSIVVNRRSTFITSRGYLHKEEEKKRTVQKGTVKV